MNKLKYKYTASGYDKATGEIRVYETLVAGMSKHETEDWKREFSRILDKVTYKREKII